MLWAVVQWSAGACYILETVQSVALLQYYEVIDCVRRGILEGVLVFKYLDTAVA